MSDQRTLEESGLPELLGRMTKDAAMKYNGGIARLDLVKGHPEFVNQTYGLWDRLATEQALRLPLIQRPPFLVARVGTLKTEADYRQSLTVTDPVCNISKWAGDITGKSAFTASIPQMEEDVEFVWASNEELGYPNGATRIQSYEAGLKLGWKPCLASDAYEIRRRYLNQPLGEWMLIAHEPIADSDGLPKVFRVEHHVDGLWINTNYGNPDNVWNASLPSPALSLKGLDTFFAFFTKITFMLILLWK
ncbi:MAG: hypothetical protein NTY30_02650 [Candidatus Berkelbacteria bacterium]|nr:hypothetical protein [Candidatus Berkelbacteria bacterium]